MTGIIPLTKGFVALVDECDYERVTGYNWTADESKWTTYAVTNGTSPRTRLHVFIMRPDHGLIVHHKDGNGLNCQRHNLEVLSQADHSRFSALRRNKSGSKYRGVSCDKRDNIFYARISVDYKNYNLGRFKTEEEAALAYNEAAKLMLGEGNFVPNVITTSSEEKHSPCLETGSGQT